MTEYSDMIVKSTDVERYMISTSVGADVDSKGNIKPSAKVNITRKLEDDSQIVELIEADISRGIDEVMRAIKGIMEE